MEKDSNKIGLPRLVQIKVYKKGACARIEVNGQLIRMFGHMVKIKGMPTTFAYAIKQSFSVIGVSSEVVFSDPESGPRQARVEP